MTITEIDRPTDWAGVAHDIAERFRASTPERERAGTLPTEELQAIRDALLPNLLIPREYGGLGAGYVESSAVISELSTVDPNVGALLAYHFTNFVPGLLDYDGDNGDLQRRSAQGRWIWGNVSQPWVPFTAEPTPEGGFVLNGTKPFNTGAITGDYSTVIAPRTDKRDFVYLAVPRDREGQVFHDDWDGFGLTRSGTVTITFTDVLVHPDEVYADTHPGIRDTFPPFYTAPGNLNFAAILVGATQGALRTARDILAREPSVSDHNLALLGRLAARVASATAFRDVVATQVQEGFERRHTISVPELVDLIQLTETLRLHAAKVGLEVGAQIFDFEAVAEASEALDLDRWWRDVRIHSLHVNPLLYSARTVGDTLLNGSQVLGPPFFLD